MASISVGSVSVEVVPSVRQFASRMRREMLPQASEVGREVGRRIQAGIEKEVKPVTVRVRMGTSVAQLERLKKLLGEVDGRTVNVTVNVALGTAVAEVRLLAQMLARLDGSNVNVDINIQIAAAIAQLAAMNAAVRSIDNRRLINIDVDTGGAMASLGALRAALIALGALSAPAIAGIGAGIVGLIGPLSVAGAGFAGLGAVAIPAISRIRQATQQQTQATQAASAAAGQAQARAFALAGAQQQLATAVRNAGHAHAQALEQVRQAQQQLTQAQRTAAAAERELAQARMQARRSIEDLRNQVISAGLAVQEQHLAIQEARADWDELAKAVTVASAKVAAAQATLATAQAEQQKVLADPAATDQAKAQAAANVNAATAAVRAAEESRKAAQLAAKQAEVNYKQSIQRLKEQQLQLRRLKADEASAAKAGVDGSDQVRSARERLAEANNRITESERNLANARANVARVDQQSADQVASARRALAQASMQAASSTSAMTGPMIKLTALEQQLANAWKGLTSAFQEWATSLQPDVIPVLIKGISFLRQILPSFTPLVKGAAAGLGQLLDKASAAAKSPFWTQFSTFVGQAVGPAIVALGTLAGNLLKAFAGIAQGFMPIGMAFLQVLNAIAERFAAFTTGLTSNPAFQQFVATFTTSIPIMIEALSALGSLIGSVFAALAPAMAPVLEFVRSLAANLAAVLQQTGPAIQSIFAALGPALSAVLSALAPVVAHLVQALAPLLVQLINGLKPILIALMPVITQVVTNLATVVSALIAGLQPAIASLVPVILLLVTAVGRILTALAPVLPMLGRFIADLVTGLMPILTPIINAIAQMAVQIAGALIEALRQSLPALQQTLIAVAGLLPALLPLLPIFTQWLIAILPLVPTLIQLAAVLITALVPVLRLAINIVVLYWRVISALLLPVLRLMVAVVQWVAAILTPVIQAIGWAIRGIGTIAMWLWHNAIGPAFRGVAQIAQWLYSFVVVILIAPLILQFKILAGIVKWLWREVIAPAFRGIGNLIRWVWATLIKPPLQALVTFLRVTLGPAFRWINNTIIKPLWQAAGTAIRWVWQTFIKPAFDALKRGVNALGGHFRVGVDAISRAWSKLKEAAKKPVAFVINTVWNGGIVRMWNAVAKLVPGTKHLGTIGGFARGGVVGPGSYGVLPGYAPGRDTMLAAVSPGEAWIRPDATRALGSGFIHGLNSAAVSGGTGGAARYLASMGGPQFGLGGIVGGFLKSAKDMFTGGLVNTAKRAFNPLLDIAQRSIGGTPFGELAMSATRGLVGKILAFFKPLEAKMGGDGSKVVKVAEKYVGLSGNPNKFTRRLGMDGLAWCFAAGTLVRTPDGYMPIEEVEPGTEIITPSGKTVATSRLLTRGKDLLNLVALGVPGTLVTVDHPYWARRGKHGTPEWIQAGDLERGDMIALPLLEPAGEEFDADLAYFLGMYTADGHRLHRNHGVQISDAEADVDRIASACKAAGFDDPRVTRGRTCSAVTVYDQTAYDLCAQAGDLAHGKKVPAAILRADRAARQAYLDGYLAGDGNFNARGEWQCTTVSRELVVSLSELLRSLGYFPSARLRRSAGDMVIEGRTVHCRDAYVVTFRPDHDRSRAQFYIDDGLLWVPVRSVTETGRTETVYDLTVPGEHAFIADGAAVHNCGMFVDGVFNEAGAKKALAPVKWTPLVSSFTALPRVSQSAKRAGDLGLYRGDSGHINIYTGKGAVTIGGNESNSVRRQSGYIHSASSIRRPRFARGGIVPNILAQDMAENTRRTTPPATQFLRGIAGMDLYDNGGWLPTGASLVYNGTGSPEPVLTDAQWDRVAGAAQGGDGGTHYHGHFDGLTKAAYESQFRTAMQAESVLAAQKDRTRRRR